MELQKQPRVLLVGASGLVGASLLQAPVLNGSGIARHRPYWWPSAWPFIQADVFGYHRHWLEVLCQIDAVVYLAFPTQLDELELWSREAQDQLLENFEWFAVSARQRRIPVLFVSSDAALWGLPRDERLPGRAAIAPLNQYAKLKIRCEEILLGESAKGSLVVRCTPVGIHPFLTSHGFLGKILGESLRHRAFGFKNAYFNPVSTPIFTAFVNAWLCSTQENWPEIYHLGSDDSLSKFDFLAPFVSSVGGTLLQTEFGAMKTRATRVADQSFDPTISPRFSRFTSHEVIQGLQGQVFHWQKEFAKEVHDVRA